jgi:thiol-disulfide isomerase/thioredoxin
VVENFGDSELARRFGVTRYPAIFAEDVLVAKPKDFGFYGKGEGSDEGRYTPWKDAKSHERYRNDLKRMIDLVLADKKEELKKERGSETESDGIGSLPDFALTDLSGKAITKEDLAGKIVLVEFWATWCPPCRSTLSWLGDMKKRYGDRLVVLAVAIESEEADVREIAKDLNMPLRWAMGTPEIARAFGDVTAVPTMYLFDSSGKTVASYFGAPPDLHTNAERAVKVVAENLPH